MISIDRLEKRPVRHRAGFVRIVCQLRPLDAAQPVELRLWKGWPGDDRGQDLEEPRQDLDRSRQAVDRRILLGTAAQAGAE